MPTQPFPPGSIRTLDEHLYAPGKKRILSLDGGGVRGLITIGFLARLESILRERFAQHYVLQDRSPDDFRLCDYFDLIGGTSTGGIIATMLALGFKVEEVRNAYRKMCPRIFGKSKGGLTGSFFNPYSLFEAKFDSAEFKAAVDDIIRDVLVRAKRTGHAEPLLDSELLHTGLAIVMKRIDTGSVWVVTNNDRMKYWKPKTTHWEHKFTSPEEEFFANGKFPLGLLVRATASAPYFLDAVELGISRKEQGVFLDGGVTPFNNPALELFLMATLKQYNAFGSPERFSPFGFNRDASETQLLLYSVGTGTWRSRMKGSEYQAKKNWEKAKIAFTSIIDDGMKSSLTWLQALSEPVRPYRVDGNLGTMQGLRVQDRKLLTFHRVDVELDIANEENKKLLEGFIGVEITPKILDNLRQMDNAGSINLERLDALGRKAAETLVLDDDLPHSFDPIHWSGSQSIASPPTAPAGDHVMFKIVATDGQGHALRLISTDNLSAADFAAVASATGATPMTVRKIGFVAARQSMVQERVETHWNGAETVNSAQPGDWIVTNIDAKGAPLLDQQSNLNRYVISSARFPELYTETGRMTEHGAIFKAKGTVQAIPLPGGFELIAPWGEQQRAEAGYLLLNGTEVYGNQKETFERTYQLASAG